MKKEIEQLSTAINELHESNDITKAGYSTLSFAVKQVKNCTIPSVSSRFITFTYLLYIIVWEAMVIGGCGYVVFWLNRSGWWMLLAVLLSGAAYTPKKWRQLFS